MPLATTDLEIFLTKDPNYRFFWSLRAALDELPGAALPVNLAEPGPLPQLHVVVNLRKSRILIGCHQTKYGLLFRHLFEGHGYSP